VVIELGEGRLLEALLMVFPTPYTLTSYLVRDMHREISKDEQTTLIPLIRIYVGMK
jgi:hypothetical protein